MGVREEEDVKQEEANKQNEEEDIKQKEEDTKVVVNNDDVKLDIKQQSADEKDPEPGFL